MGGLIVGIIGDLMVAAAPGTAVFLLGRAIVGVGMDALFAGAFAMIPEIVGKRNVAKLIGQWTGLPYAPMVVLAIIGSVLVGVNWRLAYLLVPAVCLICLFLVSKALPTPTRPMSYPLQRQ